MKSNRLHSIRILVATLFFLSLISYSSLKIYHIALDETKRNHQLMQKEMIVVSATGIQHYLTHVTEDIQLLAVSPCLQNMAKDDYELFLNDFFLVHARSNLKGVFITDANFNTIFSLPNGITEYISALPTGGIRDYVEKRGGKVWYSKIFPLATTQRELGYSVVLPIFRSARISKNESQRDQIIGYIGVIASFDWLVKHYVTPLNRDIRMSVWLMDSGGRLLFHSRHSEMVLRSIETDSADCMECHSSFNWQKRMLTSEAAFGEYTVGNEPRKIMSHIALQIHNARWMLVISSNLSDVTAVLRSKFSLFFVLVIFILAFIVITAIYFYQMNLKRIQAEEAEKLSQQKELLHLQACQASKLASVGELVDAVAHEINTPVSIIMTQADALFLKMKEGQNIFREEIEIIKKQVQRVRYYTHRLLNYSKSMPFEPKQINLSRLLDECLFLLAPRFRASSIKVIKSYAPHSLNISADRRQIEQVFINILNNAVDAIGRSGEIKLETRISNRDDSNGMEIIISDTGEGISPENLPHIFETFYSTKFAARGTGLGLSISKAIIQRHHGKISVVSERGVGTTFNVFLPVNSNNGSEL